MNRDGIILVHKPLHLTSHDVVDKIRALLKIKRTGHFGTLDPLATGLLVVAFGKATRLFPFYSKADKRYRGRIRLGVSTDTYDAEGKTTSPESNVYPDENKLKSSMDTFSGEISQIPPPFSAKKHKGLPLYVYARQNRQIEAHPVNIVIHSFSLLEYIPPHVDVEVHCSSGTYIRSLAHDLGQSLGCGAHLARLERTTVGNFSIDKSHCLDDLKKMIRENRQEEFLIPMESLLPELSKIILTESGSMLARNGNIIFAENIQKITSLDKTPPDIKDKDQIFRLFSPDGRMVALARKLPEKSGLHPFLVLDTEVSDE